MKKIIALLMAVAMMATVAVAADPIGLTTLANNQGTIAPEAKLSILPEDMIRSDAAGAFAVGDLLTDLGVGNGWKFNKENFAIRKKEISKGAALVSSVEFDGEEGRLLIKTKANPDLLVPTNAPNLVIGKIIVSNTKKIGTSGELSTTGKYYTFNRHETMIKIGNAKTALEVTVSDGGTYSLSDSTVKYGMPDGTNYATLSNNKAVGDFDVAIEGRVYKDSKIKLNIKTETNKDILKNPAYELANLNFFQVVTSGLDTANKISISAPAEAFIYEIKEGVLETPADIKWNADNSVWEGKVKTTREFVISDIKLEAAAPAVPANPATGANDVVGIAAALAVVSLVAAGAVSLKK